MRVGTRIATVAIGLLALITAYGSMAASAQIEDRAAMLERLARNSLVAHIRPGYAAFDTSVETLNRSLVALCTSPPVSERRAAELLNVRAAFKGTVLSWARLEHLRFGPVREANRYERIAFWPDAKGLGRRQVQRVLRQRAPSVTDATTLARKSVALQGLTALEIVLAGEAIAPASAPRDASSSLATTNARFRCAYAQAIAANLGTIADDLVAAWREGAKYSRIWLAPGPDNPVYLDASETALELVRAYEFGLASTRDLKLVRPLGFTRPRRKPTPPPFFISELSIPVLRANIEGLHHLFAAGGLRNLVARVDPLLAADLERGMAQTIATLAEVDDPGRGAYTDERDRQRLIETGFPLKRALIEGGAALKRAGDLSVGFNASDGD
ncbi:MAG: imelysin family protein [Pseudomonadota bacterium]